MDYRIVDPKPVLDELPALLIQLQLLAERDAAAGLRQRIKLRSRQVNQKLGPWPPTLIIAASGYSSHVTTYLQELWWAMPYKDGNEADPTIGQVRRLRRLVDILRQAVDGVLPLKATEEAAGSRRTRKRNTKPRALTDKQMQAAHIVWECKGNVTEAARRLGVDRTTVRQHYQAAMQKLGKSARRAHFGAHFNAEPATLIAALNLEST